MDIRASFKTFQHGFRLKTTQRREHLIIIVQFIADFIKDARNNVVNLISASAVVVLFCFPSSYLTYVDFIFETRF